MIAAMTTPRRLPSPDLIRRFAAIVGEANALSAPHDIEGYLVEWRDLYRGVTPLVLRPGTTAEVAAILRLANETGTAIVPQGGNTGLVGAQVPDTSGAEIVLSLKRLDRIRAIDPDSNTITVEAGVVLARVQDAADAVDRLFPLSLGSEGSCTIGGNLSSNAGGTGVLAYGNAKEQVLGLEVVLASGEVIDGLRALRKDNAGYDLKQLFLGTEGTLGVITAAVLKLQPKPKAIEVAYVGVADPAAAVALLARARGRAASQLTAFELMPRLLVEWAVRYMPNTRDPLATPAPWYVLIELSVGSGAAEGRALMELILEGAVEDGLVLDATLAESVAQANAFWRLRHDLSEVQKFEGGSIKHDVAVPVSRVPDFIEEGMALTAAMVPGCRPVPFGHLGDGNIHFNVSQPVGADKQAFLALWEPMNEAIHGLVARYDGSIAAEHGVGRLKRDLLPTVRSAVEMAVMRRLKAALDPNGILNPGRVLPIADDG
jgi:FAD/FMN-containing dehydrogenase